MVLTSAGAWDRPPLDTEPLQAVKAPVPGTVAGALERAGQFDRTAPRSLNTSDAWYFLDHVEEPPGPAMLHFDGLATVAEIYWNGDLVLTSGSMFIGHELAVTLTGKDRLAVCFRALAPHLDKRGPRARWRPQMITPPGLRLVRTTVLGYMPGWCPEIHATGPYRPIRLTRPGNGEPQDVHVAATLDEDGTGQLKVSFKTTGLKGSVRLICAGNEVELFGRGGYFEGRLSIPDVAVWWPRTHGAPVLHDVEILAGGERRTIGRTGFRRIAVDRGSDGRDFVLLVNGVRVFCRGAAWTSADIVDLPGERDRYAPLLGLAADANMNMIRIGGTMLYETSEFFALCDELGIMVWQDFMFANFDYPIGDADFVMSVRVEAEQFLRGISSSPSLAVLCGGSEMAQQAAMLGLPPASWSGPLTDELLPGIAAAIRPDVPYVPNSPSGGAMPFSPHEGVTHYYGVGAYCRPLEDARRAGVRFAAESLAFANVPEQGLLDSALPAPAVHDPRWKARVPRDRGASWDFEDIREHYLALLYGVEPIRLRREDPVRYLDLSRAVTGEVMEATFAEWRRPGSSCNGALVWTFQDLLPGAGWGVMDATGMPKAAWYALKRAFRPAQIMLTDEGTNGIDVHVVNDGSTDREFIVEIACLRDGMQPVVRGTQTIMIPARRGITLPATDLFGAFFDAAYAFRFGPPAHNVTVARLKEGGSQRLVAEAFHFPLGRAEALTDAALTAVLSEEQGRWLLTLSTDRLAQSAHIDVPGFRPSDNWFHLAPGEAKTVRLVALGSVEKPTGGVSALNSRATVRF
ncbi:MAG TPA: glycoside hydrolase family 2 protein [Mesorhizobium sp.]|jgi:beta-mannosidase|uniref:glycoside hydrolase family 2 protein n=1 Tax=Mesorhizobium sp. TaxID=1871066 RepID=UPI002DDC9135|nr:glycoside hydrolase family 2 protein [Mesorhizobium sp.]HEV2506144.1 glycoside hydrolase family 2 protein [Mesorhizobium sp.]